MNSGSPPGPTSYIEVRRRGAQRRENRGARRAADRHVIALLYSRAQVHRPVEVLERVELPPA